MSNLVSIDNIDNLEKSVQEQIEKNTYNVDTNVSLLKHYQFFPAKTNLSAVKNVLLKALMHLPNTDFVNCLYLLSDKVVRKNVGIKSSQFISKSSLPPPLKY